jgi:hypothetical protein
MHVEAEWSFTGAASNLDQRCGCRARPDSTALASIGLRRGRSPGATSHFDTRGDWRPVTDRPWGDAADSHGEHLLFGADSETATDRARAEVPSGRHRFEPWFALGMNGSSQARAPTSTTASFSGTVQRELTR